MQDLIEGSVVLLYLKQRAHWLIGRIQTVFTRDDDVDYMVELTETAELHYVPTQQGLAEMLVCNEVLAQMPVRIHREDDILGECILGAQKFPKLLQNYEEKMMQIRAIKSGIKLL